ncbi:MAG: hypothetical protein IAF58_11560 [Leptolyngbya sp.]|nr:hypothetical protein [Candidatus Melainabacteria bacterium]
MPLVFLHGVNVREGDEYEHDLELRNRLFADVFFKILGRNVQDSAILNPYWGELAPSASAGNPFLPKVQFKSIREHRQQLRAFIPEATKKMLGISANPLLALARSGSMEEMLDLVVSIAHDDVKDVKDKQVKLKGLSKFAYQTTRWRQKFSGRKQQLDWLNDIKSDEELIEKLQEATDLSPAEFNLKASLNVKEWLHNRLELSKERIRNRVDQSRERIRDRVELSRERIQARLQLSKLRIGKARKIARVSAKVTVASARKVATNMTAATITNPARRIFHSQLSAFIGDSFFYFGTRGDRYHPGSVPDVCIKAIEDAANMRTEEDPDLIVVAHSMGSNIICDITSHFAPQLEIDLVITVGAQFPLFADLDMFPGFSADERPIPKPVSAINWVNFYDPNDFLGYAANGVFEGIIDVPFPSGKFGVTTHADYFKYVSFYELMGSTIKDVLDNPQ